MNNSKPKSVTYIYEKVRTKHMNCIVRSNDQKKVIEKEMELIKKEFGLTEADVDSFKTFYLFNFNVKLGSIYNNLKYMNYVLYTLGFNKVERLNYIKSNKYIFQNTYSDFILRLALFNKIGELETSLSNSYVYSIKYIQNNLTTKELYAILKKHNYNISFKEIINYVDKSSGDVIGKEDIDKLTKELSTTLKEMNERSRRTREV